MTEEQKQYGTCKRPEAKWTDRECPKCGHSFVAKDHFGLYCVFSNCNWKEQDEETRNFWV